jgi:hypothetical protein
LLGTQFAQAATAAEALWFTIVPEGEMEATASTVQAEQGGATRYCSKAQDFRRSKEDRECQSKKTDESEHCPHQVAGSNTLTVVRHVA